MYFVEAEQETVVTTEVDMLASNYVKQLAKGGIPTNREHLAWLKVLDRLQHGDQCFCEYCRPRRDTT